MDGVNAVPGGPLRRGSFQEDTGVILAGTPPTKCRTPSISAADQAGSVRDHVHNTNAFGSNQSLAAASNSLNLDDDNEAILTDDELGFIKSASGSRRQSTASLTASQSQTAPTQSPSVGGDVIEVNRDAFQLPLDPASKGKLKNRYIMPDGTVINGKGLGRGRPGVKRGPRKSALSREVTETSNDVAAAVSTPSPGPQAKIISSKRKRKDSDVVRTEAGDDYDELDDISRESTPEYNPAAATHTRSGRQSQKPAPIITPATSLASPSTKRPAVTQSTASPSIKKHPKIKPKIYRGREQFALCEHCLRQHGPPGNVIVFCDACNKCWHQRCHDPKISKEVVEDTKAQWFCADCDKILHPKRKNKALPKPTPQPAQSGPPPTSMPASSTTPIPANVTPRYGLPLVPGMSLSLAQRKEYLNCISKERLIEIVLQAANLAPNMPIFETPMHLVPQFLPGQPYPTFAPPTQQAQTLPQPQFQPQPQAPPQAQANGCVHLNPTSTSPPPANISIVSMPPPPPPSQLPAHLRVQFTSSVAAGHLRPQPASSTSLAPSSTDPPFTSTPTPRTTPAQTPPHANGIDDRPIYTHPTAGIPTKPNTAPLLPLPSSENPEVSEEDEGYYDDFDEMALLYPKPGQGAYDMAMAPESEDLQIMLEGSDCVTFSHVVY